MMDHMHTRRNRQESVKFLCNRTRGEYEVYEAEACLVVVEDDDDDVECMELKVVLETDAVCLVLIDAATSHKPLSDYLY